MATKTDRLVSNLKYYSLGVFASKMITFLFIPIYAAFILPESLGRYQYLFSIISLCIPMLYQSIWEGMFRFSILSKGNEEDVINTTTKYVIGLTGIYSILYFIAVFIWKFNYSGYILLCGISQAAISYWQYAARALKANREYAIASIATTIVTLALNVFLIIVLRMQIEALFISVIVGSFTAALYLEVKLKLLKNCFRQQLQRDMLFAIIKYSLPLAINSISWWLVSSCNNIVVTNYLGDNANGIMTMAQRFGSIYAIVTSIISMAWQEESFRTYYDEDKDIYFNKILNIYTKALFSAAIVLMPLTYVLYTIMVQGDYSKGASLTSILYIIAAYNALVTHLGSAFLAEGKSNIMFWTTLIAGLLTLVFSVILIIPFGLMGVLIGTLLSCIINLIIRVLLLYKRMKLHINYFQLVILTTVNFVYAYLCTLIGLNILYQTLFTVFTIIVFCCYNKKLIIPFLRKINIIKR